MKAEVIEKIATLLTAAFGFVAALAWNEAIQSVFKSIFGTASSIPIMLGYAIIVTVIAVVVTIYIGRAAERAKTAVA